jgi:hypothetical protein
MTTGKNHGHSSGGKLSRTYVSWHNMKQRCRDPGDTSYHRYGGRGITFCERWLDFNNFLHDMGERPLGRTLDRIDVDGNYEPGNCKWSTPKEQQRHLVRSHCHLGHPMMLGNLYVSREGRRGCRVCRNAASARSNEKRRLANLSAQ